MKIKYECIPCIIRQGTEVAKLVTDDVEVQRKIIKNTLEKVSKLDFTETSPYMGRVIHSYVKEITNNPDPYIHLKDRYNIVAQQICDDLELEKMVEENENPFDLACKISMAGNIIDFSVNIVVEESEVLRTIENCFEDNVHGNTTEELYQAVKKAEKILFLGDNSGEIVFDKILVKKLPKDKMTYVVKGGPIVNDAIMKDAEDVGMKELVRVIDNGFDVQGTVLKECSEDFKKEFEEADLIISKGQANFETLSDEKNKEMYFMLKAKCKSVAEEIGCEQGAMVLKRIYNK